MYTMYLVSVFKENGKISLNNSENCEILTEYFYILNNFIIYNFIIVQKKLRQNFYTLLKT